MGYAELAEVLGIDEPTDEAMLVELTRKGLSVDVAVTLAERLEIPISQLSGFLHVSARTLSRHKGEKLDANLSDRLMMIGRVYARCMQLFKTDENARRWMKSNIIALGNARPIDFLDTTAGAGMVLALLGRIEHGVYS